MEVNPGR
jgi:hypothetical protein